MGDLLQSSSLVGVSGAAREKDMAHKKDTLASQLVAAALLVADGWSCQRFARGNFPRYYHHYNQQPARTTERKKVLFVVPLAVYPCRRMKLTEMRYNIEREKVPSKGGREKDYEEYQNVPWSIHDVTKHWKTPVKFETGVESARVKNLRVMVYVSSHASHGFNSLPTFSIQSFLGFRNKHVEFDSICAHCWIDLYL